MSAGYGRDGKGSWRRSGRRWSAVALAAFVTLSSPGFGQLHAYAAEELLLEETAESGADTGLAIVEDMAVFAAPPARPGESTGQSGNGGGPGTGNGGGGNHASESSAVYTADHTVATASTESGQTYAATEADHIALLVTASGNTSLNDITVTKSGDSNGGDNCNFYGQNAAVLAKGGGTTTITGGTVTSSATGANGIFSYGGNGGSNGAAGDGTTVNVSGVTITTTGSGSGGIMTTGGGVMNATDLNVTTSGGSSAPIRTDRGGGTVTVTGGKYTSNGLGSPAIYSTADITVTGAELTSNLSEGVCIEGTNTITLKDCTLTANNTKTNGNATFLDTIMIYQSMSGDASGENSSFTMTGGTLRSKNGHVFHVTNTGATINLNGVRIDNEDSANVLLSVCDDGWSGASNRATLNAEDQTLVGDLLVGDDSTLTLNLTGTSTLTGRTSGSITNAKGATVSTSIGTVNAALGEGTTWVLTGDSYVTSISGAGKVNYGSHTLYVSGAAYTASNPYGGVGSTAETPSTGETTVAVTGISLSETTAALTVGGTKTLTAAVTPSNASNSSVTWSSSDETVATVDGGKVTAMAAGTATITATAADGSGVKATCAVTVAAASDAGETTEAAGTVTFSTSNGVTTGTVSDGANGITSTTDAETGTTLVAITENGAYTLKGSAVNTYVTVAKSLTDVTLTLDGVTIDASGLASKLKADNPVISIGKNSSVKLMLTGASSLTGAGTFVKEPEALLKASTAALTIQGSGSLLLKDAMPSDTDFTCEGEEVDPADGISAKSGTVSMESGTVTVDAVNGSAIKAKGGTINVSGGTVNVTYSKDDALKAKGGTINVTGGTVNIISADGDGLKAGGEETVVNGVQTITEGTGNINISGGTVNIGSKADGTHGVQGDGIQGENVDISGGEVNIVTVWNYAANEYYTKNTSSTLNTLTEDERTGTKTEVVNYDTGSHKGIKAGTKAKTYSYAEVAADDAETYTAGTKYTTVATGGLNISGGTINVDTTGAGIKVNSVTGSGYNGTASGKYIIGGPDDALHSNNSMYISGGTITIASGDDGIGAADKLYITGTPTIDITDAFEGIEAGEIVIGNSGAETGPRITIDSNDDGINASSKTVTYAYASSDNEDTGYTKTSVSGSSNSLRIYSGRVEVRIDSNNVDGDNSVTLRKDGGRTASTTVSYGVNGDGLDCNGTLDIEGGEVYVYGQSSGDNAAIDQDKGFTLSGKATVVAAGASGMTGEALPKYGDGVYLTYGSAQGGPGQGGFGPMGTASGEETEAQSEFGPGSMMPGNNMAPGGNPGGQPGGGASISAGTAFKVADDSTTVYEGTLPYAASFVLFASPKLKANTSYTVTAGSSSSTATATAIGGSASGGVSATGLSLDRASLTLAKGGTATLQASPVPSYAAISAVAWKSSDPSVATVADGVVTGVAAGTATITATSGSYTATCKVTVTEAQTSGGEEGGTSGGETTENVSGQYGEEAPVEDAVTTAAENDGYTYYTKEMVKGQKYTFGTDDSGKWASDAAKQVAVARKTGVATAKMAGTAVLRDESSKKAYTVTVYEPALSVKKLVLLVENTDAETLSLTGLATDKEDSSMPVSWVSANPAVVQVTGDPYAKDGKSTAQVTAIGKGSAKVTAWVGGKSYQATVTVKDVQATVKDAETIALNLFQSYTPKFNGFNVSGATWKLENGTITQNSKGVWMDGNGTVTITRAGKITALREGTLELTATKNGESKSITLTIAARPVKTDIYLNVGQSTTLKHTYVKNTKDSSVKWTAEDDSRVELSNTDKAAVKIRGKAAGSTTLTCDYNGVTYKTTVHVEDPALTMDDALRNTNNYNYTLSLAKGGTYTIGQPGVDQAVVWRTSNKNVAFVSESGVIQARADKGTAVISGKVNNKTVKIKVTATAAQ